MNYQKAKPTSPLQQLYEEQVKEQRRQPQPPPAPRRQSVQQPWQQRGQRTPPPLSQPSSSAGQTAESKTASDSCGDPDSEATTAEPSAPTRTSLVIPLPEPKKPRARKDKKEVPWRHEASLGESAPRASQKPVPEKTLSEMSVVTRKSATRKRVTKRSLAQDGAPQTEKKPGGRTGAAETERTPASVRRYHKPLAQ